MGAVYRADDLVLGQPVAVKFISGRAGRRAIERLTDEVRIGRRITHPNVCRLHDIVEAGGERFLVMEFVDGEDLSSLLARLRSLPDETAKVIAHDIAAGLAAAHAEGIVHRDLKPGNVMIDGRGRARITDFGLAIATADTVGATEIAGTPAYMAPEQLRGEAVDARADIYALGLILVEIFTGRQLNTGRRATEIAVAPAEAPASLTPWVPQMDPGVERYILRSLEVDRERRPSSARELMLLLPEADALRAAFERGETPTPEMVAAAARSGALRRGASMALVLAIIAGLIVTAAGAQRARLYSLARIDPVSMELKAREIVQEYAPELTRASAAWWFEVDRDVIRSDEYQSARTWDDFVRVDPKLVRFVYRQGDEPLAARGVADSVSNLKILESGKVTLNDPPGGPGMATVVLDRAGRLVHMDWIGEDGEARSQPVGRTSIGRALPRNSLARLSDVIQIAIMLTGFAVAIAMAIRNRRSGRADVRGATRTAFYALASLMVAWVFLCNHVSDAASEVRFFSVAFGSASSAAIILWVFYTALEPFVRRRFPQALVSWTRLLNGRFGDSLVARDLLIGIAGGIAGRLLIDAIRMAPALRGNHPRLGLTMEPIGPLRRTIGNVLLSQVDAIELGIGALFLIVVFQHLFGKRFSPVAAVAVLCSSAIMTVPVVLPYLALAIILLVRFGLLAMIATHLVEGILAYTSLTLDPSAWYFPRSLAVLIMLGAWAVVLGRLVVSSEQPRPASG